jgi:hypothetical protein
MSVMDLFQKSLPPSPGLPKPTKLLLGRHHDLRTCIPGIELLIVTNQLVCSCRVGRVLVSCVFSRGTQLVRWRPCQSADQLSVETNVAYMSFVNWLKRLMSQNFLLRISTGSRLILTVASGGFP